MSLPAGAALLPRPLPLPPAWSRERDLLLHLADVERAAVLAAED